VCANLISTLLIFERGRLVSSLKPGGLLVLAGILNAEFGAVARAYEKGGFKLVASRAGKQWRSGAFAIAG
jgi:ribosomal protein L11 methylase PrmA